LERVRLSACASSSLRAFHADRPPAAAPAAAVPAPPAEAAAATSEAQASSSTVSASSSETDTTGFLPLMTAVRVRQPFVPAHAVIPPLPKVVGPATYPNWTPKSRRVGVIGVKMGMMTLWDHWGVRFPVTVIRVADCHVLQNKPQLSKQGFITTQVGAGVRKYKSAPKSLIVHCLKAGLLTPKRKLAEFPVTTDAVLPSGTQLTARHFVPGQYIDIQGITKGKGTQGGMKRWGFAGQPASHGVSLTHRSIGSVGANQSPGRVFPGKRMAGRQGNAKQTKMNNRIYKIDVKRNLLFVKGSVIGTRGGFVLMRDAQRVPFDAESPPPFPTHFPVASENAVEELVQEPDGNDPFAYG